MTRPALVVIIVFLLTVILFGIGLLMSRPSGQVPIGSASIIRGESKSDNGEGEVTVTAEFIESAGLLVFDVLVDTHSVDLSAFNVSSQVSLERDDGIVISAERVESSGSGHHQEFTLYFPKVEGAIRLVVRDLAGVPRREIVWTR
jgi:hypothetical protein